MAVITEKDANKSHPLIGSSREWELERDERDM
jgi:hypothetical protein